MTRTWSTCATCSGLLLVEEWHQVNHPSCKRDTRSALADDLLAAIARGDEAKATTIEALLAKYDTDDRNRSLGKTALWYARRGWPVFPLLPRDKRPLTRHGVHDASTDLDQVRTWWRTTPHANIGVATGHTFDVIDIDWRDKARNRSGALNAWPMLRDSGELPDIHGIAITPRSGLHILVAPQGWKNKVKVGHGLDVRGLGGYIVVAPSRMGDHSWNWVVRPSPRITGQPDWPGEQAEPDQPVPDPAAQQTERFPLDPDTGRPMNQWRVTGGHIDDPWTPTEWWQKPYRPRPRSRWAS